MLENGAESPASGARFVGKNWGKQDTPPKKQNHAITDLILHAPQFFTSLTFALENTTDLPKRQSQELAETYAEKMTLLKSYFAKKNKPDKKASPKLAETCAENLEANFRNLILQKETQAMKNGLCKMKPLACQNFA